VDETISHSKRVVEEHWPFVLLFEKSSVEESEKQRVNDAATTNCRQHRKRDEKLGRFRHGISCDV